MRDVYNTVDKIRADERFVAFLRWLQKQQPTASFKTDRRNGRAKGGYR